MTWIDRLLPGSFRGVPFRLEAHASGGGRRVAVHEFPGRDERQVDDLGRATDVIRMRAYLVGPDYDIARDRLIAAARERGPGTLVHPHLGQVEVQLTEFRVGERRREGAFCTVDLAFIEAGRTAEGIFAAAPAEAAAASEAADSVTAVAVDSYPATLEQAGRVGASAEAIAGQLQELAAFVRGGVIAGPLAAVARVKRDATRLADGALALAGAPRELAQSVRDTIVDLAAAIDSRGERLDLLFRLLETPPSLRSPVSSLGRSRADNALATANLVRSLAAAQIVREAVDFDWDTLDEAERVDRRLRAALDDVLEGASDELFGALTGLAAAATRVLPPAGQDLPSVERTKTRRTISSLVLAYERYGEVARADEVVVRNPATVRHPGRVPGAAEIEVLSA